MPAFLNIHKKSQKRRQECSAVRYKINDRVPLMMQLQRAVMFVLAIHFELCRTSHNSNLTEIGKFPQTLPDLVGFIMGPRTSR